VKNAGSARRFCIPVARLADDAAAEADGNRVGAGARLELRQDVADVRLDRLLREEELHADLAVDEAVAISWSTSTSRIVGSCSSSRSGLERDHIRTGTIPAPLSHLLEPCRVVAYRLMISLRSAASMARVSALAITL